MLDMTHTRIPKEVSSSCHTNMDSKESDEEETPSMRREMLLTIQQKIEKAYSEMQASGSSASTLHDLQHLANHLKQRLLNTNAEDIPPSKEELSPIQEELDIVFDIVFDAEEVGHSCDLCQRDLATDPERPNASLHSLQEACVLSCGHVYHFKCLRGTTLDLDNHSTDPSCIFCISHSN